MSKLDDERGKLLTFKLTKDQIRNYMAPCYHSADCVVSVLSLIGDFDDSKLEILAKKSYGRGLYTQEYLNTIYERYSTKNYEKVFFRDINNIINSELKKNEFTIVGAVYKERGHAFIVGKNGNDLFVFDPQSNVYYNKPSEYLSLYSSFGLLYNTKEFHPLIPKVTLRKPKENNKSPFKRLRNSTYELEQVRKHDAKVDAYFSNKKHNRNETVTQLREEEEYGPQSKRRRLEDPNKYAWGLQKRRKTTRKTMKKTMKKTKRRGNIKRKNTRRDSKKYK